MEEQERRDQSYPSKHLQHKYISFIKIRKFTFGAVFAYVNLVEYMSPSNKGLEDKFIEIYRGKI